MSEEERNEPIQEIQPMDKVDPSDKKENEETDLRKGKGEVNTARKVIGEALGICVITFIGCGIGSISEDFLSIASGFGSVLTFLSYTIMDFSGCHINPAVSLNYLIRGKIDILLFVYYIISQFCGAMAGSFLLATSRRMSFDNLYSTTIQDPLKKYNKDKDEFTLDAWSYIDAILIELILTYLFVLIVNASFDKKYSDGKLGGIISGITYMICVCCGLKFTRGSLNPFRSLAPAIFEAFNSGSDYKTPIKQIWIYFVGPLGGASLAALTYDFLF
ncbi:MAG: aquaporin [archaeon]|nr:aquaporin [archaeon]